MSARSRATGCDGSNAAVSAVRAAVIKARPATTEAFATHWTAAQVQPYVLAGRAYWSL